VFILPLIEVRSPRINLFCISISVYVE